VNVETSIEPPQVDEDGGEEPYVSVHVSICEDDGTHRGANANLTTEDDDALADALVQCLRGLAAMRGPGLQIALARRIGDLS
jgi:hypothetical protein